MDAFVNKVKTASNRAMRVVSLRSLDSIELARLRSTVRYLTRQRDEQLRELGLLTYRTITGAAENGQDAVIEQARTVTELEQQIAAAERQMLRAQMADRLTSRGASPFLTVCACGSPLLPDDVTCSVCGRNVEDLVRLASESKARVASVPCQCGAPLVSGIRFCPDCGRSVVDLLQGVGLASGDVPRCATCGEAASPGDRFCSACGKAIG